MEKKEVNKKKINIKELFQDRRKRALLYLAIYVIFFIFVFAFISYNNSKIGNISNNENINTNSNYTYIYDVNIVTEEAKNISYIRQLYNNKEYIVKNNNLIEEKYYYENNNYYKLNEQTNIYQKINSSSIIYNDIESRLIDATNYMKFTEDINPVSNNINEDTTYEYIIPVEKAINVYNSFGIYQQKQFDITEKETISVKIYSKDDVTYKVNMDLTNLLKYYIEDIKEYKINIEQTKLENFVEPLIELEK